MKLYDPRGIGGDYTLKAYYNGYDLSFSFHLHSTAEVTPDRKTLHLTYPELYLPPPPPQIRTFGPIKETPATPFSGWSTASLNVKSPSPAPWPP